VRGRNVSVTVLLVLAALHSVAFGKTRWPFSTYAIQPDESTSSIEAVLPPHVIHPPAQDLPADIRAWSGRWRGSGGYGAVIDLKLAVEEVSIEGATILYSAAKSSAWPPYSVRVKAQMDDGELVGQTKAGAWVVYRFRGLDVSLLQQQQDWRLAYWRATQGHVGCRTGHLAE
jgi:hypothetical protein